MSLDTYIGQWLDSLPFFPPVDLGDSSLESVNLGYSDFGNNFGHSTPPTSNEDMSDHRASPKRKRYDQEIGDATPRSNQSMTFDDGPVPLRLTSVPSLPPSSSSFASISSASRKGRPKSPVKNNSSLLALDIPIDLDNLRDHGIEQLPNDVHRLYTRLQDIEDKERFIPEMVKDDIKKVVPRAKDIWFTTCRDPAEQAHFLQDFKVLSRVEEHAKRCELFDRAEASWNMSVHWPILECAFESHPTILVEPVTHAKIAPSFVPTTKATSAMIESKMVDFTLLLWVNGGSPSPTSDASVNDSRLMNGIAKTVWNQPPEKQFINQTAYAPLCYAPIAVNIETKTATAADEGKLQLSVWTAGWFKRMSELGVEKTPTIPLIHVAGHQWHIMFAWKHESRIKIAQGTRIGHSETLVGLYQLLASMKAIGEWIGTEYRDWAEGAFVQVGNES